MRIRVSKGVIFFVLLGVGGAALYWDAEKDAAVGNRRFLTKWVSRLSNQVSGFFQIDSGSDYLEYEEREKAWSRKMKEEINTSQRVQVELPLEQRSQPIANIQDHLEQERQTAKQRQQEEEERREAAQQRVRAMMKKQRDTGRSKPSLRNKNSIYIQR